jgi:hypothetical protein
VVELHKAEENQKNAMSIRCIILLVIIIIIMPKGAHLEALSIIKVNLIKL